MTLHEQAAALVVRLASGEDVMLEAAALAKKLEKKVAPPTDEEAAEFDLFRRDYGKKGTVNGLGVELSRFTKHKDWRDVLPTLPANLARQKKERQAMVDAGHFLPEWPHLSTYLNNRMWERIYFDIPELQTELPDKYVQFLRKFVGQVAFKDVLILALTKQEFEDYVNCEGKFRGLDKRWPEETRRKQFGELHHKFFTDPLVRSKYQVLYHYIKLHTT